MPFRLLLNLLPGPARKQLRNFRILARDYGQYRTIREGACLDRGGDALPWYTYPAIEYLCNLDFGDKAVFEFGSGNSSAFWAKRARRVVSVEHDRAWHEQVSRRLAPNQVLHLREGRDAYLGALAETGESFDVIVIDGNHRSECARRVRERLAAGGMVVLDNADWYPETSAHLREALGLIEVDFHGFGPINDYTWTTSVFFDRAARFAPLGGIQPGFSIHAVRNNAENT